MKNRISENLYLPWAWQILDEGLSFFLNKIDGDLNWISGVV